MHAMALYLLLLFLLGVLSGFLPTFATADGTEEDTEGSMDAFGERSAACRGVSQSSK